MKTPRPHQLEGAEFIAQRKRCALWFRPRVGKTLTAILGLEKLGAHNPLVVCPVSVMRVWRDEFREQGWPEPVLVEGTRAQKVAAIGVIDRPVICSFESAWRIGANQRKWGALVFDESIRLSNWQAKSVSAWMPNGHLTDTVVLLSGAPCPEGLLQVAAQMLICRGVWFTHSDIYSYLREFWSFEAEKYRWVCDEHGHLAEAQRRLNIVGMPKTFEDIGGVDQKLVRFQEVAPPAPVLRRLREIHVSDLPPAQKGLRLQMAANGLDGEGEDIHVSDSFKIDNFCQYLEEQQEQEPGYACVVMCRFVAQVKALQKRLGCPAIHGAVSAAERAKAVEDFQAGKYPVIVCQVQPAKMGLDLSRAREIHYLSNDWSGDARIQSQERATNINKTTPVGIVDWVSAEIEFAVAQAVRNKLDFQMKLIQLKSGT